MTACRLVARPVRAGLRDFAEQAAIRQIWLQNEHSSQIRSYSRRAISRNIFFPFSCGADSAFLFVTNKEVNVIF